MILWIAIVVVTAVVAAILAWPLLRAARPANSRADYDLSVFRDQLAEVERELERGLLTEEQANSARTELQRRILASAEANKTPRKTRIAAGPMTAGLSVLVLAVGSFALYALLGQPGLPNRPYAERDIPREQTASADHELLEMVDKLEQRLAAAPDDGRGWMLLARSYRALEQFDRAAMAFGRASDLAPDDPELAADHGEALIIADDGAVSAIAQAAFVRALAADPDNIKARFYLAYAKSDAGDDRGALEDLIALAALAEPGAPWLDQVTTRIEDLARDLGVDPADLGYVKAAPATPPGLTGSDQLAMAEQMVASLAERVTADPDDRQGWLRLARSYQVLERYQDAIEAFARAADLPPADKEILTEYASAILSAADDIEEKIPEAMVPVLERIRAIDPHDGNALWYLGLAAAQAGRSDEARVRWSELLAQTEPGSSAHDLIKMRIDELH